MGRMYLLSYLLVAVIQNIASGRTTGDIENHHNIKRRGLIEGVLDYLDYFYGDDYEDYESDESKGEKKPAGCHDCNILINVASLPAPLTTTTTSITSKLTTIPTMTTTPATTTTPTTLTKATPPTTTNATSTEMKGANSSPFTLNSSNINVGDAIIIEKGQITLKDVLIRRRGAKESESDSDDYDDMKAAMEAFLGVFPTIPVSSVGQPTFTEESKAGLQNYHSNSGSFAPDRDTVTGPDIFERGVETALRRIVNERLAFIERNGLTNKNNKGFAMDLEGPLNNTESAGEVERNQEGVLATRGTFIHLGEADIVEGVQEVALADPKIRGGNDEIVERGQEASITPNGTIVAARKVNMVERNPETALKEGNTMVVKVGIVKGNEEAALKGGNTGSQDGSVIRGGNDEIVQKGPIVATGQVGIVQSDQKTALDGENTMIKEREIVKGENDGIVERDQETAMTTGGPLFFGAGKVDVVERNQEALLYKGNSGIPEDPVGGGGNAEIVVKDRNATNDTIIEMDPGIVKAENNENAEDRTSGKLWRNIEA